MNPDHETKFYLMKTKVEALLTDQQTMGAFRRRLVFTPGLCTLDYKVWCVPSV